MIKKLFKENVLGIVFLLCLVSYGMYSEDGDFINMSFHLSAAVIISSVLSTYLFFLIPPKYASFAFTFMFMAIGVKFVTFCLLFGYGLYSLPETHTGLYVIYGVIALLIYRVSLFLFMDDEIEGAKAAKIRLNKE